MGFLMKETREMLCMIHCKCWYSRIIQVKSVRGWRMTIEIPEPPKHICYRSKAMQRILKFCKLQTDHSCGKELWAALFHHQVMYWGWIVANMDVGNTKCVPSIKLEDWWVRCGRTWAGEHGGVTAKVESTTMRELSVTTKHLHFHKKPTFPVVD